MEQLPFIEEKLHTAQCHDALDNLRLVLKIKTHLILFRNKNVCGQREGTWSRFVIQHVYNRARTAAEKDRAAHAAKLHLSGPGEWEAELKVLADADIRGYQDPNTLQKQVGRQGIWEDGQVAALVMCTLNFSVCNQSMHNSFLPQTLIQSGVGNYLQVR